MDILNEPCTELGTGSEEQIVPGDAYRFQALYSNYKNTPEDLHLFYNNMITAIRTIDQETPVIVESGYYAQPPSYTGWPGNLFR